jgi:flavodoxin I
MKALVVYDSTYGNTEKIAQAIGEAIGGQMLRVGQVNPSDLKGFDLVIVGSPTHGGRPTPEIQGLLKRSPALKGVNVAAFDTRHVSKWTLLFGYAAPRIAQSLKRNGGTLLAPPEGFFVLGTKGPLKEGERRPVLENLSCAMPEKAGFRGCREPRKPAGVLVRLV